MKKVSFLLIFALIFAISISYADVGDVIGSVYSTDIKTFINGKEVLSCNIGGKTAIPIDLITDACIYDNDLRVLIIKNFNPASIKEAANGVYSEPIGTPVTNIYETDIKVYMYNKLIPSYNIGGVTCVAVEDLALDNAFSDLGGKFIWNPEERTINLEFIYMRNSLRSMGEYRMDVEDSTATFVRDLTTSGGMSIKLKNQRLIDADDIIIPVYYKDQTLVGYLFKTPTLTYTIDKDGNGYLKKSTNMIDYFYEDVIEEIVSTLVSSRSYSMGDIVDAYLAKWNGTIETRFTGDSYILLYIKEPTVLGSNDHLLYIRDNGTAQDIIDMLPENYSKIITVSKLKFDKSSETATFDIKGLYNSFKFDMKNGELNEI